jgi:diguanylate cyclase (GGDEF)-like protein
MNRPISDLPACGESPSNQNEGLFAVLHNSTVMMIDDDLTTLEFVQKFLERAGYTRLISTANPRTAMSLIEQTQPDIVLLDLMMPDVNGFEILAGMRRRDDMRYTPVIVLTADSAPGAQLKALDLGATDFLTKPVNPSELRLRVRNALAFKAYQDRLADFDALTGLMNRRKFTSQLAAAVATDEQSKRACALMHLDLDRFKAVNETLGYRTGDKLLCAVAERMHRVLSDAELTGWPRIRSESMKTALSRLGGNGFAALLPNMHNLAKVEKVTSVARNLLASLAEPFEIDNHQLRITASIGVAVSPDDGEDVDVLLKNVETAMYEAKQRGGHAYEFFSGDMKARAQERQGLESHLRNAVQRDEFLLYFQPQLDIVTQRVTGCEALIRWRRPEHGIVAPDKFMRVAEDTGMVADIGRWVLRAACRQASDWRAAGMPPLTIAINIANVQLQRRRICDEVLEVLTQTGLPAERLMLEVSESTLMEHPDRGLDMLYELKELGVRLALNDFCTRTSSLEHLSRFPIDQVKIHRSLVAGLPGETEKVTQVSALCALAKALRFDVLAVGVETREQLNLLRTYNCLGYQGHLFSRPAPAEMFRNLVRRTM